jgi:hypothetical protein
MRGPERIENSFLVKNIVNTRSERIKHTQNSKKFSFVSFVTVNTHTHTYISMTIAIELRGGGIIICIFRDSIASVIEIIKICSPL